MADEKEEKDGEEGQQEGAAAPAGKLSRKKLLIVIGGVVACLVLVGTPVFYFFGRRGAPPEVFTATVNPTSPEEAGSVLEGHSDEDQLDEGEEALGTIFPLESFVVNLGSKASYLRCQVQLEFEGLDVPQRFYVKLVPIRENIIRILSSRKPEEVLSWPGKEALAEEIKSMINDVLRKPLVREVYFTQFVIQ